MAFTVNRSVSWRAGEGTPEKYTFSLNAVVDVVSVVNNVATISVVGTIGVQNYPTQSRNSFPASDFAVLTVAGKDPADYQFTQGVSYYQSPLPALPNAPQSYVDAVIAEFRGDTYISDGNNKVSLYTKNNGVVVNAYDGSSYQSTAINTTFTINIPSTGNVDILIWNTSGCSSSTAYTWLQHEVWASWFDLDYRPGASSNGTSLLSHNRSAGVANIYNGSSWVTMRTTGAPTEKGNPPSIYHDSDWWNQRKLGQE